MSNHKLFAFIVLGLIIIVATTFFVILVHIALPRIAYRNYISQYTYQLYPEHTYEINGKKTFANADELYKELRAFDMRLTEDKTSIGMSFLGHPSLFYNERFKTPINNIIEVEEIYSIFDKDENTSIREIWRRVKCVRQNGVEEWVADIKCDKL